MSESTSHRILNRLNDTVRQFRTAPELPVHFVLEEELNELDALQKVSAPKSQVLGCARILEALSVSALATPDLPYTVHVFCNLDALQQFNLIPTTTRYWAHALRRLGNDARHMRRRIDHNDADLSMIYAERCLEWYFCVYRFGPRCERLTNDGEHLGLGRNRSLLSAMADFERHESNPLLLAERWVDGVDGALPAPDFASALAESLLDRKKLDEARRILDWGLASFPADIRLRQLDGLFYSRTGDLEVAQRKLKALRDDKRYDDETAGIMAGVCKRLWQQGHDLAWLRKSFRYYRSAWNHSSRENTYLGINAATTAMWLAAEIGNASPGNPQHADFSRNSQQIAQTVRDILDKRRAKLDQRGGDLAMNYWDQATLAEAYLILGDLDSAGATYRSAIQRHPEQQANIEVTKQQALNILRFKGLSDVDVNDWFG